MKANAEEILEAIKKADPSATGEITIVPGGIRGATLVGNLQSSFSTADDLAAATDGAVSAAELQEVRLNKKTLTVTNSLDTQTRRVGISDEGDPAPVKHTEVRSISLGLIQDGETLKRKNPEAVAKLQGIIAKTGFFAPVILNDSLEIIDGYLRVEVARNLEKESIPAVIVAADDTLSTFLRLVFNRSSEFQRWDFTKVDEFADKNLNLTGYLEPFGIFGRNIVPQTFLGETVKNYEISEFNDQQKYYTQSVGLAEWARRVRDDEAKKAEKASQAKPKKVTTKSTNQAPPLFANLGGDEPGASSMELAESVVKDQRGEAGVITENYDEFRGEKATEQSVRRSSKKKTLDNRLAAESTDVDSETAEEADELD